MVRTDFVSNSSSSSFVVWGMYLDKNELITLLKNYYKKDELDKIIEEDESLTDAIYDKDIFNDIGLDYCRCAWDLEFAVGLNPEEQKNDQTLQQFKESIAQRLSDKGLSVTKENIKLITGVNADGEFNAD